MTTSSACSIPTKPLQYDSDYTQHVLPRCSDAFAHSIRRSPQNWKNFWLVVIGGGVTTTERRISLPAHNGGLGVLSTAPSANLVNGLPRVDTVMASKAIKGQDTYMYNSHGHKFQMNVTKTKMNEKKERSKHHQNNHYPNWAIIARDLSNMLQLQKFHLE